MFWSVFVDNKLLKRISLEDFPKFNWRYEIDGKFYELNSIGWTNHDLRMTEVSEWKFVKLKAPVLEYQCECCGYKKFT